MILIGTNFYANIKFQGHEDKIHLGKKSAGWRFLIRENRKYYRDVLGLFEFVHSSGVEIVDEYGKDVKPSKFCMKVISTYVNKNHKKSHLNTDMRGVYSLDGYEFCSVEFS